MSVLFSKSVALDSIIHQNYQKGHSQRSGRCPTLLPRFRRKRRDYELDSAHGIVGRGMRGNLYCSKRDLWRMCAEPARKSSSSKHQKGHSQRSGRCLELLPRFELGTSSLPRMCSTN